MLGPMAILAINPARQGGRELGIDQKTHSGYPQDTVVELFGGVLQGGADVLFLQIRVVLQDLGMTGASGQQVEDIRDPDAHATDAGAPAALMGVDGDTCQRAHRDLPFPLRELRV